MSIKTKASDWEIADIAGTDYAVGGVSFFQFKSASAGIVETVYFAGMEFLGTGFEVGATASVPNFTAIKCAHPFSIADLHRAGGRISSAGLAVGVGYQVMFISASNGEIGNLFDGQQLDGLSIGIELSAGVKIGLWHSSTLASAESRKVSQELNKKYLPNK